LKKILDHIYNLYNQKKYVYPDPLAFLYEYNEKRDREIAGLVCACLAYGRVEMIMKTLGGVFEKMNSAPFEYITCSTRGEMERDFKGFRYRFADETNIVSLLWGIRKTLDRFSSLENCFYEGLYQNSDTIMPGLVFFSSSISEKGRAGHLVADPEKGSPCKRSMLFLRWMVREDEVDPGGWNKISPGLLIVPLDTHMHRIGKMLGFTGRRNADMKTAMEITSGFKKISEQDPVKYDFCLTRFGIRREMHMDDLKSMVSRESANEQVR